MSFIKNKNLIKNTGNALINTNNVFGGNIISTNALTFDIQTNFFTGKSLENEFSKIKNIGTPIVNINSVDTTFGNICINNLKVINYGVVTNGIIYNFQSSNCAVETLCSNQIFNNKGTFQQVCANVIQSNTFCTNQLISSNSTITNSLNKCLISENANVNNLIATNGNINLLCSSLIKSNVVDTREVYTLDIESISGKYNLLTVGNIISDKIFNEYANIKVMYLNFGNIADCNISSMNLYNGNITNANITNGYMKYVTIQEANILNLHIDAIATPNVNISDTLNSLNAIINNLNLFNGNIINSEIINSNITNGNIFNAFMNNANIDLLNSIYGKIFTLETNIGYVNKLFVNEINGAQFGNNGLSIANVEMENISVDGGNITNNDPYYQFLVNGFTHIGVFGTYTNQSQSVLTVTSPRGGNKETLALVKEDAYGWFMGYAEEDEDNSLYLHDGGVGLRIVPNGTSFSTTSDKRFKKEIKYLENSLDKIDGINGIYFKYNQDDDNVQRRVGVIAQEVLEILPEAVDLNSNPEKAMTVRYIDLIPLLINCIKELKEKVNILENK